MLSWVTLVSGRYTLFGGVSLMSFVSIIGLVMGVAVLILVLSVVNGFEKELRERVLSVLPHGVIQGVGPLEDYQELLSEILKHEQVIDAAPYVNGSSLLVANHLMQGVSYSGVLPAAENRVSTINKYMLDADLESLKPGEYSLLIGKKLSERLKLNTGDKVSLVLPEIQISLAGPLPRLKQFRVAGVFQVGSDIDANMVYMHIDDAKVLKKIKGVMGLRLLLKDMFRAPEVIYELTTNSEMFEIKGRSWFATHGNLYNAIKMQKSTMLLLLLLLIAVAAFNVVSNLIMTVNEKQADIAILKTMGATPSGILLVFIVHGAMLGIVGVLIGLVLGLSAALGASDLYHFLGVGLMDEYFIHYLPSQVLVSDVIFVTLSSFLICILASIYPALKAAKSLPVETLQYAD